MKREEKVSKEKRCNQIERRFRDNRRIDRAISVVNIRFQLEKVINFRILALNHDDLTIDQ